MSMKFKGVSSDSFGLVLKTKSKEILPKSVDDYQYLSNFDGSVLKNTFLSDRIITVTLSIVQENSLLELWDKIHDIGAWLYSEKREELEFAVDGGLHYMAKVENSVVAEVEGFGADMTVTFRCEPFLYSQLQILTFNGVNSARALQVVNFGVVKVPTIIEIVGTASTLAIANLQITNIVAGRPVTLDSDKLLAYDTVAGVKTNKLMNVTGEFLDLAKGATSVGVNGTSFNVNLTFKFKNRYI